MPDCRPRGLSATDATVRRYRKRFGDNPAMGVCVRERAVDAQTFSIRSGNGPKRAVHARSFRSNGHLPGFCVPGRANETVRSGNGPYGSRGHLAEGWSSNSPNGPIHDRAVRAYVVQTLFVPRIIGMPPRRRSRVLAARVRASIRRLRGSSGNGPGIAARNAESLLAFCDSCTILNVFASIG